MKMRRTTTRQAIMKFYYVYILQSENYPERFYSGLTDDMENRLKIHNQGKCKHTSKYTPWKIKTAIAFTNKNKAMEFEKYLKKASGRAFAKKRL
jgi:putative endonuclease